MRTCYLAGPNNRVGHMPLCDNVSCGNGWTKVEEGAASHWLLGNSAPGDSLVKQGVKYGKRR